MLIENFSDEKINNYLKLLKSVGSLSIMFADSPVPYLNYRVAENIFCLAFNADNLSRHDCSIDARIDEIGIGIKTFLNNNAKTYQKIAEFNRDSSMLDKIEPKELAKEVSRLRNERLLTTQRIYGVKQMIYHCITRENAKINIYECNMDFIDIKKISHVRSKNNSITFNDGNNEYLFNKSKHTLFKRFYTLESLYSIDVRILRDPYTLIQNFDIGTSMYFAPVDKTREYVVLPLYSERGGINVPERSGLNQWNASGRPRNYSEAYIQIPSIINKSFPNFFPPRDRAFKLNLPDKNELSAKVCQDDNKALMSNPNKALGEWMLRQVLDLKEGELLTYDRLQEIGLDSVVIYKDKEDEYSINFLEMGSYEKFIREIE